MANNDINSILYLFDRPIEPVFIPKGPNRVMFHGLPQYLPERFRPFEVEITDRFCNGNNRTIQLKDITMPDMSIPMELGREQSFSLFVRKHTKIAGHLIKSFMDAASYDDFQSVAAYSRDSLNPYLFNYALAVAILHREDTRNIKLPPMPEIFPSMFIDRSVFLKAKEQANVIPAGSRVPIVIPKDYTASDLDEEHRLAYFREDVGVNLHHWHWHLVHPHHGDRKIVDKDRRGELFYYMHQQLLARYNCERFCNKLSRVKLQSNLRDEIPEAYFPKLNDEVTSKSWASRPPGLKLSDINRPVEDLHYTIDDVERWRDRILFAINKGEVSSSNGETIKLTEENGIQIIGNIVEASMLGVNERLYGDLHNTGHVLAAYIHDPDYRYLESSGVMGETATAMRDPLFYRWHAEINDIFLQHKKQLPEYTAQRVRNIVKGDTRLRRISIHGKNELVVASNWSLSFPGIEVTKCQIISSDAPVNTLMTFWTQSDINLARGLDFQPQGDVLARLTHLDHFEFKYRIMAMNLTDLVKMGTVRIFIGPLLDERGLPFDYLAQKELMIEMDKFTVQLQPGQNVIERNSTDSSVTISYETVFSNRTDPSTTGSDAKADLNFCGCGWPHYMIVPRGTVDGYPMVLFVMISNHDEDFVPQAAPTGCADAASFCGMRDRKYPDSRSMGYPFDRKPRSGVQKLSEFLTGNMATAEIHVNFTNAMKTRSGTDVHVL